MLGAPEQDDPEAVRREYEDETGLSARLAERIPPFDGTRTVTTSSAVFVATRA